MKNVLSLESVVQWLGEQSPTKKYNYADCTRCALHQYFTHVGFPIERMFMSKWEDTDGNEHPLNGDLDNIVSQMPYTFGAAHDRGLDLIQERKGT
jgi:hypothetical protein